MDVFRQKHVHIVSVRVPYLRHSDRGWLLLAIIKLGFRPVKQFVWFRARSILRQLFVPLAASEPLFIGLFLLVWVLKVIAHAAKEPVELLLWICGLCRFHQYALLRRRLAQQHCATIRQRLFWLFRFTRLFFWGFGFWFYFCRQGSSGRSAENASSLLD